jgi:HK97 family phage prohead protease
VRLAGYAALFGRRDAARDAIRSLPSRSDQRIGWVESVAEDARGLRVIASVDHADGVAASALRRGTVSGLSFGYRAQETVHSPQGRELIAVELLEVSLVTHPLQHGARVHLVREGVREG